MRISSGVVALALALIAGCTERNYVPCDNDAACDYLVEGACRANPATGTRWCAEPDTTCPSGLRWDDLVVGDGIAGMCVPDDSPPACTPALAWVSERDGNSEIYASATDGSGQTNLTRNAADEEDFVWSPDGSQLAFTRLGITNEIWVMNADGSGQRGLSSGSRDSAPAWSPDGSRIAFMRIGTSVPTTIWVIDVSGGPPTKVSLDADDYDGFPSWSPDGSKLAFESIPDGETSTEVFVMDPDGSNRSNLTMDGGSVTSGWEDPPQWSPDGAQLTFTSNRSANLEVWRFDANGGNLTNLTQSPDDDGTARWIGDGSTIYFTRVSGGDADVFSMNSDGSGQAPLGVLMTNDETPSVSTDGGHIAWTSHRDGNAEIYAAAGDGTGVSRITNDPAIDGFPAWQPCP